MLMILPYFPSGGCVNDVVNNRTNHQFTSVYPTFREYRKSVLDYQKNCF